MRLHSGEKRGAGELVRGFVARDCGEGVMTAQTLKRYLLVDSEEYNLNPKQPNCVVCGRYNNFVAILIAVVLNAFRATPWH